MRRELAKPVKIGEKRTRYTMKIVDEAPAGVDQRSSFFKFLDGLLATPALLMCGPDLGQKFFISHDNGQWVMTVEAEVDDA